MFWGTLGAHVCSDRYTIRHFSGGIMVVDDIRGSFHLYMSQKLALSLLGKTDIPGMSPPIAIFCGMHVAGAKGFY